MAPGSVSGLDEICNKKQARLKIKEVTETLSVFLSFNHIIPSNARFRWALVKHNVLKIQVLEAKLTPGVAWWCNWVERGAIKAL